MSATLCVLHGTVVGKMGFRDRVPANQFRLRSRARLSRNDSATRFGARSYQVSARRAWLFPGTRRVLHHPVAIEHRLSLSDDNWYMEEHELRLLPASEASQVSIPTPCSMPNCTRLRTPDLDKGASRGGLRHPQLTAFMRRRDKRCRR